jgi:hypothetical protein
MKASLLICASLLGLLATRGTSAAPPAAAAAAVKAGGLKTGTAAAAKSGAGAGAAGKGRAVAKGRKGAIAKKESKTCAAAPVFQEFSRKRFERAQTRKREKTTSAKTC